MVQSTGHIFTGHDQTEAGKRSIQALYIPPQKFRISTFRATTLQLVLIMCFALNSKEVSSRYLSSTTPDLPPVSRLKHCKAFRRCAVVRKKAIPFKDRRIFVRLTVRCDYEIQRPPVSSRSTWRDNVVHCEFVTKNERSSFHQ